LLVVAVTAEVLRRKQLWLIENGLIEVDELIFKNKNIFINSKLAYFVSSKQAI
jgi:hypothetical protein